MVDREEEEEAWYQSIWKALKQTSSIKMIGGGIFLFGTGIVGLCAINHYGLDERRRMIKPGWGKDGAACRPGITGYGSTCASTMPGDPLSYHCCAVIKDQKMIKSGLHYCKKNKDMDPTVCTCKLSNGCFND